MRKWILNRGFRVFFFKKSWRVAYSRRSFSTEPGWQENFWMYWFFDFQPSARSSHQRPFFIFGKFLQYLWSSHLPLVDSSSYQGAPFRCGAFAFFHMMLAPRLPLKIPRSTRVRESYSCKFGNAYSWTSLQRPPWVQKKSGHCKDEAVRRDVFNKSQCMDFLSAGTKKSGLCQ